MCSKKSCGIQDATYHNVCMSLYLRSENENENEFRELDGML